MDDVEFKINILYGRSESRQFNKFENGRMYCYSYRIDYGRDGKEISRTEPAVLSSIRWGDGSPFTEDDYICLSYKR